MLASRANCALRGGDDGDAREYHSGRDQSARADQLVPEGPAEQHGNDGVHVRVRGRPRRAHRAQQIDVSGKADQAAEDDQVHPAQQGSPGHGGQRERLKFS